jgi:hypothetical protein
LWNQLGTVTLLLADRRCRRVVAARGSTTPRVIKQSLAAMTIGISRSLVSARCQAGVI